MDLLRAAKANFDWGANTLTLLVQKLPLLTTHQLWGTSGGRRPKGFVGNVARSTASSSPCSASPFPFSSYALLPLLTSPSRMHEGVYNSLFKLGLAPVITFGNPVWPGSHALFSFRSNS